MRHTEESGARFGLVLWLIGIAALLASCQDAAQTADVGGQGGEGESLASNAAHLERTADGVFIEADVPTPEPGSYEYPTADMALGGGTHPPIEAADTGGEEVFTLWGFVFNYPENCTDGRCDADDVGDTPARGGVFQLDAAISAGGTMPMKGGIRLGQVAGNGIALENPLGAEIHAALAPHGKALEGQDLFDQMNVAVGNPSLWWAATFSAP